MNKYILFYAVTFVFFGCGPNIGFKKKIESITFRANINSNMIFNGKKIKTNIELFKDSLEASVFPLLGSELAKIKIKNKTIYIHNNFKSKPDTIFNHLLAHNIKPTHLYRKMVQKNLKRDTVFYQQGKLKYIFTNYKSVKIKKNKTNKIVFLPKKITIQCECEALFFQNNDAEININYKSITFNYN